jgi:hypothetical protein
MTTGSTRGNAATRPLSELAAAEASEEASRIAGLRRSSGPDLVSFASIL